MTAHFHVGQKVVCVDDSFRHGYWTRDIPVRGQIYTVTGYGINEYHKGPELFLEEISNDGWGFDATRFRPVIERKTDISIFTDMLKPQTVDA